MIKLINGRGQVGEALKKAIKKIKIKKTIYIYHTWNFLDKSEKTQEKCYNDFIEFVNKHKKYEIVFISTKAENKSYYLEYKLKAENYLQESCDKYKIVRLPNLIGKGICERFKNDEAEPKGTIELCKIDLAAKIILAHIMFDDENRTIIVDGYKIPAYLLKCLIQYGVKK